MDQFAIYFLCYFVGWGVGYFIGHEVALHKLEGALQESRKRQIAALYNKDRQ